MNILFYYPNRERSVALSSLMIAFQKQGHIVSLLTHEPEGALHIDVKKHGIQTFTYNIKKDIFFLFYLKHIFTLASFTKKNKIDVVYSHIQLANIISVFSQFLSPARFIICRHHSDCAYVDKNWKEKYFDLIINMLGKEFLVPSQKVYTQMVETEKIRNKNIYKIRYAYNFEDYEKPDLTTVNDIRKKYKCRLLLIKVARLIPEKRHILLFKIIRKMVDKNIDVKLLVLSDGWEKLRLLNYIAENNLQDHIYMLGYKIDVINFIAASDLVVHVSASEASNNLIKEVGLCEKPVIVCQDVGDFDEYIINNKNGIIISKTHFENELTAILEKIYDNKIDIQSLGKDLKKDILRLFSIENIIGQYEQFHGKRNTS